LIIPSGPRGTHNDTYGQVWAGLHGQLDPSVCEADNELMAPLRDWLDRHLDPHHQEQPHQNPSDSSAQGFHDHETFRWDDEVVANSPYGWEIAAGNLGLAVSGQTFWEGLAKKIEGTIGDYHVQISYQLSRIEGTKFESTALAMRLPSDVPFTDLSRRFSSRRPWTKPPSGPYQIDEFSRRYNVKPNSDRFVLAGGLHLVSVLEDVLGSPVSVRSGTLKRRFSGRPTGRELEQVVKAIISAVDRVRPNP